MTPEHITAVCLAVLRDGRVLCVRKDAEHKWILPGGMPEAGELDIETLGREITEELDCAIRPSSIDWLAAFRADAADRPGVTVTVRVWIGELDGEPRPSSEITELRWVPFYARGDDLAPSLRQILPELGEYADGWRW